MVAHNRIAIRPDFYQSIGYPDKYKSVAPAIGIEWRPKAEKGIVLKLDYEQGFKKLLGSNIDYGRAELDAQTILYSSRRQSYSMRFGTGFYTRRGAHWDFVDYCYLEYLDTLTVTLFDFSVYLYSISYRKLRYLGL